MIKNIFIKSLTSVLFLTFCALSQPVMSMEGKTTEKSLKETAGQENLRQSALEKPIELSESDFFERNFRVLHLDMKDQNSLQDTLNTLEMFERSIQIKTGVKFIGIIEHFDLVTSNFYGSELALLLSCSRDGQFPLFRISELKSALKEGTFDLTKLNLKDMKLSQTRLEVLLPTHNWKIPFINTQDAGKNGVDMEQLITYFKDHKYEGLKYKNNTLKKEENFSTDEWVEAKIISDFQSIIVNKCEIWSVGDNSQWKSRAFSFADRFRIDLVKNIINSEKYEELIEEFTLDFKIETTLGKTMPWFYYYAKKCNHKSLDLAKDNFSMIEEGNLFSLINIVIHNNIIENVILKDGVNVSVDELSKALSFWERKEGAFTYQEASTVFKRCGYQNLADKLFYNPEDAITNCLTLTYLYDHASILSILPREVINIICIYYWQTKTL